MNSDFLFLMALGDSYGMKYEFVPHAQDRTAADLFHGPHPKFTEYQTGHYTDDTQMSLANLELLLTGRRHFSDDDFVTKWLDAFKRDPHQGYSKYMWKVLSESETATAFRTAINPTGGHTSGAAMRAAPFGLLADIDDVKRLTLQQAVLTHDTQTGKNSALAVALAAHFLHHGGRRRDLPAFLDTHIGAGWNSAANGFTPDTGNGLNIVTQALAAVQAADTMSGILLAVVNNDGLSDTDTICAIAAVIASRAGDVVNDLPQRLTDGLENGRYGAAYLKQVDMAAAKAFPPTRIYAPPAARLRPPRRPAA
jgi:ADP-ribosylglycohydrolase